jgi:hypothetical protein
MTKVRIEMDEGWRWWPITEAMRDAYETAMGFEPDLARQLRQPMTLDVDQDLIDRYTTAYVAYRELQDQLEQLYRVQQGIDPWPEQAIPEYKVLEPKDAAPPSVGVR